MPRDLEFQQMTIIQVFQIITKADVNSSSERKANDSILRRVTNTVSGLFSNSSWSEWLKGSGPSTTPDDRQDSFYNNSGCFSSSASNFPETMKEKHLNQLYPEEGIADTIDNEVAGLSTSQPASIENSWAPLKNIIPPFKEDQSFMASTPSLSPYLMKRGNEDLLGDPMLLKPSTSNFHSELLPPRDDSDNTLKHSFIETHAENYNCQTNGSISSFPSSRKRIREPMEGEMKNGDINVSASKKRSLTHSQMFTEDAEESVEQMTRKRPRFSISTYGSPLYSKIAEEEPSFSIFYPGKIMYGGASNHRRKRNRVIPRKICPRTPTTVSANDDDHSDGGLSSAARRILDCIDKISTPLSDSKRAFQFSVPRDFSFNSSSFVADFHKNRPIVKMNTLAKDSPPVTKLLTPSKVKITKNFSSLFAPKSDETETSLKEASYEVKHKEVKPDSKSDSSSVKIVSQQKTSESFITKEKELNEVSFRFPGVEQNSSFVSSNNASKSSSKWDSSAVSSTPYKFDAQKSNIVNDQNQDSVIFPKTKENLPLKAKNSALDNVDYKFSNPSVVSDLSLLEKMPSTSIEFRFSQPINEAELTSSKEGSMPDIKKSGLIIKKSKWDCDTCLLQNDESVTKCAACEAPKPQKSKVPESVTTSQNWGCAFKKPEGSWECESCLLLNKSDQESCVACFTPKPKKESNIQEVSSDKKLVSYSGSWGEAFKRPEGLWDCPKCLLQNKASVDVCASCEAPKSFKNNSGINPAKSSLNNWGEAFKPSEGSWVCESCLVHNTSNCSNCLCCKSAKPKSENESKRKSSTEMSPLSFDTSKNKTTPKHQDDLKSKENVWICPECFITNNSFDGKCISCKYLRPNSSSDSPKQNKISLSGSFPSQFLKGKDEWECETCCVRNKNSKQKCQSCDTPRASLGHSDIVSEALTGNFKFDANPKSKTNDPSSTFKFGIAPDAIKEKSSGFSFGVNPVPSKNENPIGSNVELEKSSGFSFGINTSLPKEEKPSNSNLNVNSSKELKSDFTFGVNPSKDIKLSFGVNSSNDIKSDTLAFGVDATPSKNEKSNSLNVEANQGSTKEATTGGFSFGVPVSTSGFSFGVLQGFQVLQILKLCSLPSKEPSKPITFDITGVKSSNENTFGKPATSSILQLPVENKASPTSITSSSGSLMSSNLIFGATPASTVSLVSPSNVSDSVSTTTTSTTSFSFFKPSVPTMVTKPAETVTSSQESKSNAIFQFGSTLSNTQNSGTKFEFPKLDNSNMKNSSDFFSQGFPKVNPTSFNFFGNSGSTQSVDNKPSIPSFGDSKPPLFGESKTPSFGESKSTSSLFVFGNNDVKSQNTGFSFGKPETSKATPNVPTFGGFGSSLSQPFKFGQQEPSPMMQTMNKNTETAAPSSFNYNVDMQNPFNATSSVGPQKSSRITRKAHRRLKS
ncbi:E3 SUMO-protein ligase RanBP2 [Armadillidium nasatum]|uniref:Nuclear pore complex protein Nup153 n=1 Tax=Armadillidium nasatum TaxID=96803 RepID=A0A5N5TN15_9CRUS|nr:E3 SUMO-protein ligase RanBP2 [Armadillidium nasatum]